MPIPVGAAILASSAITGAFNAKQASKNRGFQRNMSNTQYQRSAKDLEAAGLNRVLALGSPASTPSGSTATAPDMGASAQQAIMLKKGMDKIDAETNLLQQQGRLTNAEASKQEVLKVLYQKYGPQAEGVLNKMEDMGQTSINSAKDAIGGYKKFRKDMGNKEQEGLNKVRNWWDNKKTQFNNWVDSKRK